MPKLIQTTAGFVVAFEIELAMICDNDYGCGLYLSQHNYWSATEGDRDGWICKTQEEWQARILASRKQQDRIRGLLRAKNFIDEMVRGVPPRRHSKLNVDVIQEALDAIKPQIVPIGQNEWEGRDKSNCPKGTNSNCPKGTIPYLKKDLNLKKEIKKNKIPSLSPQGESVMTDGFLSFWERYPKKVAKGAAWRAWKAGKCEALTTTIVENLATHEAMKRERQFIPNPSTWLNQKRWEDEVPARAVVEPYDFKEAYRKAKERYDNESA